jgi:two-component system chemotaxis response regulator CheY
MKIQARILVVDDSLVVRRLVEMSVRQLGDVEIVCAKDGMEGLRFLTEDTFDIAFVDINMPVMDGLTLLRLYRENPAVRQIPILMVTTEGDAKIGSEAMQAGASGFVTKPIDGKVLRSLALELIAKDRSERGSADS